MYMYTHESESLEYSAPEVPSLQNALNTHELIYIRTYMYIYIFIYIYLCIQIHLYMHTYIYIYMYRERKNTQVSESPECFAPEFPSLQNTLYMHIQIYTCVYIFIRIFMYGCIFVHKYIYTCIHVHTYIYICTEYTHESKSLEYFAPLVPSLSDTLYIYIYMYIYIYLCIYIHIYIYKHVDIRIFIHTYTYRGRKHTHDSKSPDYFVPEVLCLQNAVPACLISVWSLHASFFVSCIRGPHTFVPFFRVPGSFYAQKMSNFQFWRLPVITFL